MMVDGTKAEACRSLLKSGVAGGVRSAVLTGKAGLPRARGGELEEARSAETDLEVGVWGGVSIDMVILAKSAGGMSS